MTEAQVVVIVEQLVAHYSATQWGTIAHEMNASYTPQLVLLRYLRAASPLWPRA